MRYGGGCVSCGIDGGSRVQGVQVPCQGSGGGGSSVPADPATSITKNETGKWPEVPLCRWQNPSSFPSPIPTQILDMFWNFPPSPLANVTVSLKSKLFCFLFQLHRGNHRGDSELLAREEIPGVVDFKQYFIYKGDSNNLLGGVLCKQFSWFSLWEEFH